MECPACKGNIPEGANFCPYCGKVVRGRTFTKWWFWAAVSGALVGAGLIFGFELLRERKIWDVQETSSLPQNRGAEGDMNF